MPVLIPIPTTTTPPVGAGMYSARMPATFFPSTSTSLGHLSVGRTPVADSMADAAATPVANDNQPSCSV